MDHFKKIESKCVDWSTAKSIVDQWKASGEKVVFTNGCFDILHKGHVTYLAKSADLGTRLVVAVNDDASVRSLGKGENRPINDQDARMLLLAALSFVDLVIVFTESTPLEVIELLVPSILVKGGDYDPNESDPASSTYIVGSDCVRAAGGSVVAIDLVNGYSTTSIIEKTKQP